jgi:xanthine dehydrogenase iron-sulfur cluster and FAD-binding subunit A
MTPARLISLLLFLLLGAYALQLIVEDRREASMLAVADLLERRQFVTVGEVADAAASINMVSFGHSCRSDILRPGLVVMLSNLERMNQAVDYQAWADANAASQTYLSTMIRCTPADGNAWLRDALVAKVIAEDPAALRDKMEIARALMPYEAKQLFARLYFWKRLSPLALKTSEDLARADIRATLLYGSTDLRTKLRQNMSDAFADLVKSEAEHLPKNPG